MKIKMLVSALFIIITGNIYAQERSSSVSKKSSSSSGSRRRAISQNHHFKQSLEKNTKDNGTSFHRKKYLRIMHGENEGFARRGTFFKKKKENEGFSANGYRYKPNRKKGIR